MVRRIDACPFRILAGSRSDNIIQEFGRCLKYGCPAYRRRQEACGEFDEKCLMFERAKMDAKVEG